MGTALNLANMVPKFELKTAVAANMISTLQAAYTAFASNNVKAGRQTVEYVYQRVSKQSGKTLTAAQASQLTQYAMVLMK